MHQLVNHPDLCSLYTNHNPPSIKFPHQSHNHQIQPSNLTTPSTTIAQTSNTDQTQSAAMREMIFRMAAMQPVDNDIDPESVRPPKRRNVTVSSDPQSVAARHRRERFSEKIRILQRIVPGGTRLDTASMLDEAILYVKFLKSHVEKLEREGVVLPPAVAGMGYGGYVEGFCAELCKL